MDLHQLPRSIGVTVACLIIIILIPLAQNRALAGKSGGGSNQITSIPRTMSYQGIIKDSGGDPVTDSVYSVTFKIFNVASGGTLLWDETLPCTTSAGYFNTIFSNVNLPFDEDYWLELEVGGDILDPRQKMSMVGYAAVADTADYAFNAPAGGGGGWVDDGTVVRLETTTDRVGIGILSPAGILHVAADSDFAVVGTVTPGGSEDNVGVVGYVDGGSGTNTGVSGNANNGYVNRGVSGQAEGFGSENIGVFGYAQGGSVNWAGYFDGSVAVEQDMEVMGKATIGPGHTNTGTNAFVAGESNTTSGDHSTVGGGTQNAAGGYANAIGGGFGNSSGEQYSTIAGGQGNIVGGLGSAVGGGLSNQAVGRCAAIGGGFENTANGFYAAVMGGRSNAAGGSYSFSAGRRAKANHNGAFVWGDGTDADFASTANNQFLIRASGGVGIGTNSPIAALHADGEATGNDNNIGVFGNAATGTFNKGIVGEAHGPSDENIGVYGYAEGGDDNWAGYFNGDVGVAQNIEIDGKAGIGATNPTSALEVVSSDSVAAKITSNFSGQHSCGLNVEVTDSNEGIAIRGYAALPSWTGGRFYGDGFGLYSETSTGIGIWVDPGSGTGIWVNGGTKAIYCRSDPGGISGEFEGLVNIYGYLHIGGRADIGVNNMTSGLPSFAVGESNSADGWASIAAGYRAKADHNGTFVWGDSTAADFSSTAANQFLIRASGGVGIGTNSPQGALDVSSTTGAFIVPRMTTAERDALTAVNGMIIYNTTDNQFNFYENGAWVTK